jgi:hypothetical protein
MGDSAPGSTLPDLRLFDKPNRRDMERLGVFVSTAAFKPALDGLPKVPPRAAPTIATQVAVLNEHARDREPGRNSFPKHH